MYMIAVQDLKVHPSNIRHYSENQMVRYGDGSLRHFNAGQSLNKVTHYPSVVPSTKLRVIGAANVRVLVSTSKNNSESVDCGVPAP